MSQQGPTTEFSNLNSDLKRFLGSAAVLLFLVLAMFGDVLFFNSARVLSNASADLYQQFFAWRAFGFGELRAGNLALWNPYVFCGTPFAGGFQSALFYPPNALFLAMPLLQAINWSIALHIFLAGIFMCGWARSRGLSSLAALVCGVLFMFCGAHFLHVFQGHLGNLCSIPWVPLIFWSIDRWLDSRKMGWCVVGMVGTAMQVLAGQPQYVFYTAVAAAIYCALSLARSAKRGEAVLGLLLIGAGGAALSAVQLLTGVAAARETLRSTGLSYVEASSFSLPPENLITLAIPGFFGDMVSTPYWGRWYLWETSLFIGVGGLMLALIGGFNGARAQRRFCVLMITVLLLLAFGKYTPLFPALYKLAPGFDKFRGMSKFALPASAFLVLLAGVGFDQVCSGGMRGRVWAAVAAVGALVFGTVGLSLNSAAGGSSWWHSLLGKLLATGDVIAVTAPAFSDVSFLGQIAAWSARCCFIAALTSALLVVALGWAHRALWAKNLLLTLVITEVFVFARISRDTFDAASAQQKPLREVVEKHPGDWRMANIKNPNSGMVLRAPDVWGYDSVVQRRYAELMTFLTGGNPDEATQYVDCSKFDPLFRMLRCRFAVLPLPDGDGGNLVESADPMPRFNLISSWKVLGNRDEIFRALRESQFDPVREVILESAPPFRSATGPVSAPGSVRLLETSTDHLLVEAEVAAPSILFITDAYSRDWHATGIEKCDQSSYQVIPANYAFQGVPLAAGHHKIKLEYRPTAYLVGKWISLLAVAGLCGAVIWLKMGSRKLAKGVAQ